VTDSTTASNRIQIVTYRDEFKPAFESLNLDWIEEHFWVEDIDRQVLSDPKGTIVDHGGEVFFAVEDGVAVGTCALIQHDDWIYELSKMAVHPSAQGRGLGNLLMDAMIGWARERHAKQIFLESNTVLGIAIKLYEKYGFETTRLGEGDEYERSNIRMTLELSEPT
jgi:ribosomal protein S18 acetylase RimI-like enzyme